VRSVNDQTGKVEIVPGEGVQVKNSGGQIVISIKKDEEEEEPETSDEPIVPGNEPSPSPSGGGGGSCGCDCDCCSGGDNEDDSGEDSPCDHPGSSGGPGGVSKGGDPVHYSNYDAGGADFHGGSGGGGGVAAEDEPHEGSDDCCTG
jgi:hypothetical protein